MTVTKKKVVENTKDIKNIKTTTRVGKNSENLNHAQVLCIQYPIAFEKKFVLAFFNLGSEVNASHIIFTKKLELLI